MRMKSKATALIFATNKLKESKETIPFPSYPFTLKPQHGFPHIQYALRFCLTGSSMPFKAWFLVGIIADFSDLKESYLY